VRWVDRVDGESLSECDPGRCLHGGTLLAGLSRGYPPTLELLPRTPVWHHINLSLMMPSYVGYPTCNLYRSGAKVCPVQYWLGSRCDGPWSVECCCELWLQYAKVLTGGYGSIWNPCPLLGIKTAVPIATTQCTTATWRTMSLRRCASIIFAYAAIQSAVLVYLFVLDDRAGSWSDLSAGSSFDKATSDVDNKSGWHSVSVFYGRQDLLKIPGGNVWKGQARQDRIVADLFSNKRDGYFVDLAAYDAVDHSNTLALERELGWKGE
jgi:hypothetical protein